MDERIELGRSGEDLAARWYERAGFSIVERNYRCRQGEIDLVARKDRLLVFCEVKTRSSRRWGEPSEAVAPGKQARLRRLAAEWMGARRPGRCQVRFDVVSVIVGRSGNREVVHLPDAF